MKVVFIGASALAVTTAQRLLKRGHEVIIIENDKNVINEMRETIDCVFINGNGSKPAILKETAPDTIDVLFCLTKNDESNIIASLVARSLGVKRVITRIEDPEFEHICIELGLNDIIIPTYTNARYLAGIALGRDIIELSAIIRGDVRFFGMVIDEENEGTVSDLDLPGQSRAIFMYRENLFEFADSSTKLKKGDELVVITHGDDYDKLVQKWPGTGTMK
ncbi:MAG: potassium channel family protein [Gammaproteobacteria bacterium]